VQEHHIDVAERSHIAPSERAVTDQRQRELMAVGSQFPEHFPEQLEQDPVDQSGPAGTHLLAR